MKERGKLHNDLTQRERNTAEREKGIYKGPEREELKKRRGTYREEVQ